MYYGSHKESIYKWELPRWAGGLAIILLSISEIWKQDNLRKVLINDSRNSNFFIGQFNQYGVAPQAHNQQVPNSNQLVFHTSQMGPTPQAQQQQYMNPQHIAPVQQPHATEPLQQNSQQQNKKKGTAIRLTDPNTGKDLTNEVFKHKEKTASSRHGGSFTSNIGDEEKTADVNAQFAKLVRYFDFVDQ